MTFYTVVMAINTIWHFLAGYHFLGFPARTIARYTKERPVNRNATEIMRFLGGLNFAVVALGAIAWAGAAGWSPAIEPRWVIPAFFAAVNFSQFAIDVDVHRRGMTNSRFVAQILVGDGIVTVLNLLALAI